MTPGSKNLFALAVAVLLAAGSARAATITIVNADGPGEGFNDPTPVAPVAGNAGATLGQQRLNVFQAAADAWGAIVDSSVEIPVIAAFDPADPGDCTPTSGVLGAAGPTLVFRDGALPISDTWYPFALANAVLGMDAGMPAGQPNVAAVFNSDVDDDPNCLTGVTWWYGIGAPPAAGTIDLFTTVFHEIAHGLGFTSFVDRATGAKLQGFDDVYMRNLEDHSTGELWPGMTNGERAASAIDTGDLHWVGPNAVAQSGMLMAGTHPSGHIRMYSPNPLEQGSSVAHWDTVLTPDEVMEPFLVNGAQDLVTTELMQDIGWPLLAPSVCMSDATTLCLPANDRFRVTVSFFTSQGAGNSGDAQAIPLDSLGTSAGGLFYFTNPTDPQFLVKIINGCPVNNRWWVFYAATTNVGFDLTVTDTSNGMTRVYSNPDINAAPPIQDTMAFATCP